MTDKTESVVDVMARAALMAVLEQDYMFDSCGFLEDTKVEWLDQSETDFVPVAQAALSALKNAGYAVVPVEPTEAMVDAGAERDTSIPETMWSAMIQAATGA